MNEQLDSAIAELLKTSKDGVVSMAAFIQQQAPDLAKEIIQWAFWSSLAWIIFSTVILFCCFKVVFGHRADDYSEGPIALRMVAIIISVVFIFMFIFSVQDLIKCLVAPKVYIMDLVKGLIKSTSK